MHLGRQFQERLISGSVGFLALYFTIFFSNLSFFQPFFILFTAIATGVALYEYYCLTVQKGFSPLYKIGILSSSIYILGVGYTIYFPQLSELPSFILLGTLLLCFLYYFQKGESPLGNLAVTLFGILYVTLPLACVIKINYFFPFGGAEDGRLWLAYVLAVSKITDVAAYFTGMLKGKSKLAPNISPKKTKEGAIGGLLAAISLSFLFGLASAFGLIPFHLTLWQSLWIGSLLSILAQLGDLTESLLKRDAKVKDSNDLPGLGGMLDIIDSLVFTLPFLYLLLQLLK